MNEKGWALVQIDELVNCLGAGPFYFSGPTFSLVNASFDMTS
jgi:hypothetical protein